MQTADDTLATADARRAPEAPTALGRYRLTRRLGAGAFGVVWLAHDERLDRIVAVKRIELHDEQVAARAEREALAAARLQHPGIVALYEAGRDEHAVYLVSELVRGRTLGDLVEDGALSDRDILRIGAALCDALAHAHARGVVHRDVKPANIIVPERPSGEAGLAKLTDFGVATMAGDDALTRTGDVVGTLAYMAPEQAEGLQVEGEADLYALALVLYEALSGVNPIRAGGAAATARRVGTRLPPLSRLRRDLPREACAALDRAVLPRPEDRGTLEDLRLALDDAVDGAARAPGPVAGDGADTRLASPVPARDRPQRGTPAVTRRALAASAAAALVAATAAVVPASLASGPGAPAAAAAATALAVSATSCSGRSDRRMNQAATRPENTMASRIATISTTRRRSDSALALDSGVTATAVTSWRLKRAGTATARLWPRLLMPMVTGVAVCEVGTVASAAASAADTTRESSPK